MRQVRFFDIEWDTDDEVVNLPSEKIMEVDDNIDLEDESADVLSDKYGWCVSGCSYEILPENLK